MFATNLASDYLRLKADFIGTEAKSVICCGRIIQIRLRVGHTGPFRRLYLSFFGRWVEARRAVTNSNVSL